MQRPGILPSLRFENWGEHEYSIVRKLSHVWFITFARQQSFKKGFYSFIFAKPTDKLVELFQFNREILIVFPPFLIFDMRALDFVDKTIAEFQNRLDKLCVVLISKDPEVGKKIKDVLIQDKESRIIVPFSQDEFLGVPEHEAEDFIIKHLQEFFYNRDLFAYDSPLRTDNYFFGRSRIVHELYGKYKAGENASIFGLRKIGKTSVLFAVRRLLKESGEPSVYIDCSEPSLHQKRWYEALHFIARELSKSIPRKAHLHLRPAEAYTPTEASQNFEHDLMKIHSFYNKARILIVLDEIENLTFQISPSEHWADDKDFLYFWQSIRAIYQKRPNLFSIIIAGVNPTIIETPTIFGVDNPIFGWVTPRYLEFFSIAEVREMISYIGKYMGLIFAEEVFTYLVDDFGGHPFLTRQACSYIHKQQLPGQRPFQVVKFTYQQYREKVNAYLRRYVREILGVLKNKYPDEYELLEYLAQGDQQTFGEFAEFAEMVNHLLGYGLIVSQDGFYYFRIKAVEDTLREDRKISKLRASSPLEAKWSDIARSRGELEQNLRQLIKLVLKVQVGVAQAKEKFLDIIPPRRKKKLSTLNLDEIFSSRKTEIYFSDLKKIVVQEWGFFERVFGDKQKFEVYMDYVNEYRADAHAAPIDNDQFAVLKIALDWLSNRVNEYLR